ncbi:membrane protein [Kitasatospora arboriphila]|uniref:Membrane protein n=1 Tax=Kitasatospora arboriphila TaxID=258052 RepID=A0ABN1T7N7_9ACTN
MGAVNQRTPGRKPAPGPEPEPIRFFGTTWVDHGGGYWLRRVLVSLGALVCTAAAALVLRFAVAGVTLSDAGRLVDVLLIGAVAICSCLAAIRTWKSLTEGRHTLDGWMAEDRSLGAVWLIGGVGALAAYFFRSLVEAPGEAVHRAAYEKARRGRR